MSMACLVLLWLVGEVPIPGYLDYVQIARRIGDLASKPNVQVTQLATSRGGKQVSLITIASGEASKQRAILIVGSAAPSHLVGGELAIRIAEQLAEESSSDAGKKLLENVCFYIIPWPSPDATASCFRKPTREPAGNGARSDDDRDFQSGEDPNEDLNGDGVITMMRVSDPSGGYREHPSDKRILVAADPKMNEKGAWRLLTEGIDNDKDKVWNEDSADGVSFNRNFTFKYPYFKPNAGPHQISEPETRAVCDFCYDHNNIVAVYSFGPEDNLTHTWKPDARGDAERIRTTVASADAPYFDFIAKEFSESVGLKDASNPPRGEGAFSEWAYFHFGRWSLVSRGWSIPKLDGRPNNPPASKSELRSESKSDVKPEQPKDPATQDKKGTKGGGGGKRGGGAGARSDSPAASARPAGAADDADQLNALRWLEREKIDGFVPWKKIENHPDFPNQTVEVGGFRPFVLTNPPAKELDGLAKKHTAFVKRIVALLPNVEIAEARAKPLGGGLYRLGIKVRNTGFLPTMSEIGRYSQAVAPLMVEWDVPADTKFLQGSRRGKFDRLTGNGGVVEREWIVRVPADAKEFRVKTGSPNIGWTSKQADMEQ